MSTVIPPSLPASAAPAALPADWLLPHQDPRWARVRGVQALFTSRAGGVGQAPFDSLNLGDHVRDDPQAVATNRQRLAQQASALAQRPVQPVFLQQVHGCDAVALEAGSAHGQAFDACVSTQPCVACTIMVADCLPVLLAHESGWAVGAAHAGWRGLLGSGGVGVIEQLWLAYAQAVRGRSSQPISAADLCAQTCVWLGPCIGPQAFEVGDEVRSAFVAGHAHAAACFVPQAAAVAPASPAPLASPKWLANLPALARQRLQALGLDDVAGNDGSAPWCTVQQAQQFFSHRRDAARWGSTGRMAAAIWLV